MSERKAKTMSVVPKNKPLLQLPDFKKTILLGVKGKGNLDQILAWMSVEFQDHHIQILDKDLFNSTVELVIKKNVDWREEQGILAYTSKRENIQQAIAVALKIEAAVGTEWFTLNDLVEKTNFTYGQARATMDLQYAFGFLAKDMSTKPEKFKSISSVEKRIEYMEGMRNEMAKELQEFDTIIAKAKEDHVNQGSSPDNQPIQSSSDPGNSTDSVDRSQGITTEDTSRTEGQGELRGSSADTRSGSVHDTEVRDGENTENR